jgi:2-dehydro-3-deoxygluconokinase
MRAGRHRVVAFGELLMRLEPPGHQRIVQAGSFDVAYTGAEANAAALLASLGVDAACVSRVPGHEVGQACIDFLRRYGVDTTHIGRGGDRLAIFFLETGAAQRASKVVYDRAHTSLRQADADDFDWEAILDGADWLHFSGTAPASGPGIVRALETGLAMAGERGVRVSCDLNYRSKLWSPEEAREAMTRLMRHVDVLIGNEEDASTVFGIAAEGVDVVRGELRVESYRAIAEQLASSFELDVVATTLRTSISASVNRWAGLLYDGSDHFVSRTYEIDPIVDRVGGGDAFSGALIYGLLEGMEAQACVEFAAAASCLKHSIPGDFALLSRAEIEALVAGDASGRVRR